MNWSDPDDDNCSSSHRKDFHPVRQAHLSARARPAAALPSCANLPQHLILKLKQGMQEQLSNFVVIDQRRSAGICHLPPRFDAAFSKGCLALFCSNLLTPTPPPPPSASVQRAWSVNMSLHIKAACAAWKPIPAFTQTDICMQANTTQGL